MCRIPGSLIIFCVWKRSHSPSVLQIAWAGSVTIGALGGSFTPESVVGLDFALTAFFLVLCIDMCRNRKNVPVPLVALGCAVVGNLLFSDGMLVAAIILLPYLNDFMPPGIMVILVFYTVRDTPGLDHAPEHRRGRRASPLPDCTYGEATRH